MASWTIRRRRGFTLIELMVVSVVLALLAVTVLPAMDELDRMRRAAALSDLKMTLTSARALAVATGDPCGVEIDAESGWIRGVRLPPGGEVLGLLGPLGEEEEGWYIGLRYAGAEIAEVEFADGSSGDGTVWFGSEGELERRADDGEYVGAATSDVRIEVADGGVVEVDRVTGLVR